MSTITSAIIEELHDDMISHGWLAQAIKLNDGSSDPSQARITNVLSALLETGQVEIGLTHQARPDYLEFVAWNGTAKERISKAMEAVAAANGPDKQFAYWLCLRQNVDRFQCADE
jgi:hypothetical protein